MIPIIIFIFVAVIGTVLYFTVFKKKDIKNKVNIVKLEVCQENEVKINNVCKRILDGTDCQSERFLVPDEKYLKTSCREMNDTEKTKYCEDSGLIYYLYKCRYVKSNEDCEREDQFSKPNPKSKNTTCVEMTQKEKEDYCLLNDKVFFDDKCVKKKSDDMCPKQQYLKLDPDTNFTTCKKMSENEIRKLCEQLNKKYSDEMCVDGVTIEECKNLYNDNEPLFYKIPNSDETKCVDLPFSKKVEICSSLGKKYDGTKCNCPKNTRLFNNQCLGGKSEEQCFNEIKFSKPNKASGNTSCILMSNKEREEYCAKKDLIYYENDCKKVLTVDDCKIEKVDNDLFKKIPNKLKKNTECRNLTNDEKEKICIEKDRIWDGNNCLIKLTKPNVKIIKIDSYHIIIEIKVDGEVNISDLSVKQIISESEKTNNDNIGEIFIEEKDSENRILKVKISKLKQNINYKLKLKVLTNKFGLESPFSDELTFKTICDSDIYTRKFCRSNFGPDNTTVSKVTNKDPDVTEWPFFKVPKSTDGKICGCRSLTKTEAKNFCKNAYYPNFFNTNRDVIIKGDECIPAPIAVGPPLNPQLKVLEINQKINSNKEIENILNEDDYKNNPPYRIFLKWSIPDLSEFKEIDDVFPTKYIIYRKNLLTGENYQLIDSLDITDKTIKEFSYLDIKNLESETLYKYKIIPENSVGEGPYSESIIKTKKKRLLKSKCNSKFEDPDEELENNKGFKGFEMKLDILNNKCVSMPVIQRNIKCDNLNSIVDNYNNIYNPETKKCIPLTGELKRPSKPNLSVSYKTARSIKLNIIPPNDYGLPSFNNYILLWVNITTGDKGRLTHGINYGEVNIAGSESESSSVYIKPHPTGLDVGVEIIHNNLNPANTYKYSIAAVSFNDKLWDNYDGDKDTEDNRSVGKSEFNIINVTTYFSIPLKIPNINILGSAKVDEVNLLIDKFEEGYEGGTVNNTNRAEIKKYKIKRELFSKNQNTYISSDIKYKEFIISLDNINQYNSSNIDSKMTYDVAKKEYVFKDTSVQPMSNYRYYIYAMNNQVNLWSELKKYTDITTPELSPFYECENPTNFKAVEEFSNQRVNKVIQNLSWDNSINPNVNRYKKWDIFTEFKNYPKYEIIINSRNKTLKFDDIETNNFVVRNLETDSDYKINLIVRHKGLLKLQNGYKIIVETTNYSNSYDENHQSNIVKPLIKNIKTNKFTDDNDCKKNDLYYDNTIFANGKKIPFYLDNSVPRKCLTRMDNFQKLTEYCQQQNNNNFVFWNSTKECKNPKDGNWKKVDVYNKVCTRNGLTGDYIVCGGGKRVKNKYVYEKPDQDMSVKFYYPNLNGKDVDPPTNTIEYLENGVRVAYEFEDCSTGTCENLCKSKYGQLQDVAKVNGVELPLTLPDMNGITYCKRDVKQPVTLNLPSEICNSCGNYNTEKIKRTWKCLDGFAGKAEIIKCNQQTDDNNANLNIKGNVEENIVNESDRIEGKWYKCQGLVDTTGKVVPHQEYKNVEYCNPPYTLQRSEKTDSSGNNILIKRHKYFMQKTKNCTEIPYCKYQKTKDRFPAFTNYCGEQTVSTNKVCIGPDGNSTTFDKCGSYTNSGDYKLTKTNTLQSCQDICEGPKNNKSLPGSVGYDKWISYSDKMDPKTESEFKNLCKLKTLIPPKYYTEDSIGIGCGSCGNDGETKEVYDVCEDGLYGPSEKIKCELADSTKAKYNNKSWTGSKIENVDCEGNDLCSKRKVHYSNIYRKTCPSGRPFCEWKKIGDVSECSAHCNGGKKLQNVICQDGDLVVSNSKCDGSKKPATEFNCNTDLCSQLCTKDGNKWVGKNVPYTEKEFNTRCLEIPSIPRSLFVDERTCDKDAKGCGLREIKKTHYCIDGAGKGQKSCKEYIDKDNSGRTWIKKSNKTNLFYDEKKDCFKEKINGEDNYYYDNFEECHDISNRNTWDETGVIREQYYSNETVPCLSTNAEHCNWKISNEIDYKDCHGTIFREYKCVDENDNPVTSTRCSNDNKPPENISLGLTCEMEPGLWYDDENDAKKDLNPDVVCDQCGIKKGKLIYRSNKCKRSDNIYIANNQCVKVLQSVRSCPITDACK